MRASLVVVAALFSSCNFPTVVPEAQTADF